MLFSDYLIQYGNNLTGCWVFISPKSQIRLHKHWNNLQVHLDGGPVSLSQARDNTFLITVAPVILFYSFPELIQPSSLPIFVEPPALCSILTLN